MTRVRVLRTGAALLVSALALAAGVALQTTAARFNADTRNGPSSFSAGTFPGLDEVVMTAVCETAPELPLCAASAASTPGGPAPALDDTALEVEPVAAPSGAPAADPRPPRPSPGGTTREPEDDCGAQSCAVQVVTAFADQLGEQHAQAPEHVPEEATRTIQEFAGELRREADRANASRLLDDATRVALDDLAKAGVVPEFSMACMTTVGQMADLVEPTLHHEGEPAPSPSASPSAQPSESPQDCGASASPSPSPSASPRRTESASPSPSPSPSDYPYDPPGVRRREMPSEEPQRFY